MYEPAHAGRQSGCRPGSGGQGSAGGAIEDLITALHALVPRPAVIAMSVSWDTEEDCSEPVQMPS